MCKDLNERVAMAAKKYPEFKGLLSEIVPKAFEFNYKEIKTFEDACKHLGLKIIRGCDEDEYIIAYKKLVIIVKAINNGWRPDWTNKNQPKYYPYFEVQGRSESCNGSRSSNSGFGFRATNYACNYVTTNSGSRLCFETREQAEYAGKQFVDLYEKYLM